jgi:pilus assembly protein CpaE
MTLLWTADLAAKEQYDFAVGNDIVRIENSALVTRALTDDVNERLVVIGPDIDASAACELAELCRIERPEVGVILLRRRLDITVLAQALRAGVREVIAADDMTGLASAARRSRELSERVSGHSPETRAAEGRVVTVFSAKGGVGKTTFSTNLSAYLADSGSKVLLVDLDLAFGDVGISLQLLPERSIGDLSAMAGHLDEQGLASIVTRHDSGLDAACAPAEPSDADRISGQTIAELLRVARKSYDFVVIDTPPAFTEHVLAAFDISDVLVLIATLDIPAVKNLRLTLDTLDLLGSPKEARVVVLNRADAKVGLRAQDVVTAIMQDIAVEVPNSTAVPASVNRGVPIVLDEPKHPVSVALRLLADTHLRLPVGVDEDQSKTERRRTERWSLARGGRR